ncbi:hypothetical protein ACQ4M4_00720 [Leptolyngbya sp. AN02str]|uniref:hypothetical protein n=1 Tax=Leptolyngbya sp. AN02str TaxID=3423363 RepID=UPI003D3245A2
MEFGLNMNRVIQDTIVGNAKMTVDQWVAEHPVVGFFVMHPRILLGLVVVGILLLTGLFGAVSRMTEGFWLRLIRMPFILVRSLGRGGFWLVRRALRQPTATPTPTPNPWLEIAQRLEALRHEQDVLMQDIQILLQQTTDVPNKS